MDKRKIKFLLSGNHTHTSYTEQRTMEMTQWGFFSVLQDYLKSTASACSPTRLPLSPSFSRAPPFLSPKHELTPVIQPFQTDRTVCLFSHRLIVSLFLTVANIYWRLFFLSVSLISALKELYHFLIKQPFEVVLLFVLILKIRKLRPRTASPSSHS